jgi:histidinol-phosphate aminotransferase
MKAEMRRARGADHLVRPLVYQLHPYVPGEQPKIKNLVKLNTNENPYPPSPEVLSVIRAAVDGRLRLYPNPTAQPLREKLAKVHRCSPENIIIGNGSDELLALATRTFVEPTGGSKASISADLGPADHPGSPGDGDSRVGQSRSTVQYFTPSYSLYPVLAEIHGARTNAVRLGTDFSLPPAALLQKSKAWDCNAALTFITTPNAPSGRAYATTELEALCRLHRGVVILDEAYVDFAEENALSLALNYPQVLIARTFSKAYSLCFQRVGYFVGSPALIAALDKMRDSYNVNGLGQVGAAATLDHLGYYRANFRRIKATRQRLGKALSELNFDVLPSQANFILVRPPMFPAKAWQEKLRERKILVRWFPYPEVSEYLRITVGTDAEADALLKAARATLAHPS